MVKIVPFGSNSGFEINFKLEVDQVQSAMHEMDRWAVPYITAGALNDVVFNARKAEKKAMPWYLDRPTAYTQRGVIYTKASKDYLVASVSINDERIKGTPQARYLAPNIEGGPRQPKPYEKRLQRAGILGSNEYTVPGSGAPINGSGNIPGGRIERMLSQLQAAEQVAGYLANETARSRKRNAPRRLERYFVSKGDGALPRGIWMRKGRTVRAFLIFVSGAPNYKPIYPFGRATREYAERNFARHWIARFERMASSGRILR